VQTPEETLIEFLLQYYDGRSLPRELLLPFDLADADDLAAALLAEHPDAKAIAVKTPKKSAKADLVALATKNAAYRLDEVQRTTERRRVELEILKDKLSLARVPRRIECIDISNTQGAAIVASCVCFIDGRPAKDHYRSYTIQTVAGAP